MTDAKHFLVEGTKTYFIQPDLATMPEDFLEHFFQGGFETYYLFDDPYLDLKVKVRTLFELFPGLILFFNIDRELRGGNWPEFIARLHAERQGQGRIGVFYSNMKSPVERAAIERRYLYDIGIVGGCIPIDYRKSVNLERLKGVLLANQANGRRRNLRMVCGGSSSFNVMIGGLKYEGEVRDISISHFSCVFRGADPDLRLYEKATDIQLKIPGAIFTVQAVVFTKRMVGAELLYVFVFRDAHDRDGLDPDALRRVNRVIFNHFSSGIGELVHRCFDEVRNACREVPPGAGAPTLAPQLSRPAAERAAG